MPTFEAPAADAAEAQQALRGLAHATRSIDDPREIYATLGSLSAAAASLGLSLHQIAALHDGPTRKTAWVMGDLRAGRAASCQVSWELRRAGEILKHVAASIHHADEAETTIAYAHSSNQRPLSRVERALLDALLADDFAGAEPLCEQARNVLAMRGCQCGCGTIDLVPQDPLAQRSTARSPVEVQGRVLNADREEIGGLLLFLKNGQLSSLEIYSYDEPLLLPELSQVIWQSVPRREPQRTRKRVDLSRGENPWQSAYPPGQRHSLARPGAFPPCWQPARHRVRRHVAAGLQVGEEARDDRQPPGHRAGGNPRGSFKSSGRTRLPPPPPARCAVMNPSTSAGRTSSGGMPTTP